MKNIFKNKKIEDQVVTNDNENMEEETEMIVTPKWSLKKKLLVGGSVLAGLAIGAAALISKNKSKDDEDQEVDLVEVNGDDEDIDPVVNEIEDTDSTN